MREHYSGLLCEVEKKLNALSGDSIIASSFRRVGAAKINELIQLKSPRELEWGNWPPLFVFLINADIKALISLDDDLRLVIKHAGERVKQKYLKIFEDFRMPEPGRRSAWAAELFEIYGRSALLKSELVSNYESEPRLANGREPDVRATIDAGISKGTCKLRP